VRGKRSRAELGWKPKGRPILEEIEHGTTIASITPSLNPLSVQLYVLVVHRQIVDAGGPAGQSSQPILPGSTTRCIRLITNARSSWLGIHPAMLRSNSSRLMALPCGSVGAFAQAPMGGGNAGSEALAESRIPRG